MSRGTEMGFDLDSIITTAKKADNILGDMVEKTIQIKNHMHEAFSLKGDATATQYIKGLKEMMSLSQKISDTKLTMDVDSSTLKGAKDALGLIVEDVRFLSKEGIGIFDTKGLYATNQGILTTEDNLSSIRERMAELRKEWSEMVNTPYQETPFSPPLYQPKINEKTGKPYGENTKAQKENFALFQEQLKQLEIIHNKREQLNAKDHEREKHRKTLEIELEMKALVELEAKAKKELSWAKMTQDEKAAYIKKRMDEVLKVEQKNIAQIQSEYKKLWGDLKTFSSSRGAIEKAAEGKTLTPEQQKEYDALISLEQETESKIQRMYSEHQDILSDITVKEVAKRSKLIADELKKQKIDAPTALSMASSAKTGSQMKKAKQAVQDALMEVDIDDIDTINDLNKAYLNLRASIEKLTKAQENEQTLQPTVRNEYRRVLKELEELDKAKKKLQSTDAYRGTLGGEAKMEADDAMNALLAREQDLNAKRVKYREEAGNLLDEVEREHASRQAQISVQEFEKAQKELEAKRAKYGTVSTSEAGSVIGESKNTENVRQAEKAIKDLIEVRDKLDKKDAKYEETVKSLNEEIKRQEDYIESVTNAERHRTRLEREKGETFQGAMDYSRQAKSINELKRAMDFLEAARRKEDLSTSKGKKNYQQLTAELERQRKKYEVLAGTIHNSSKTLINLGDQLKRSFALLFSVSQLRGYVNTLTQVRGEFELQQRSLQAILQNKDEANRIWKQTVDLAIHSPFRIKELVTYTKQLAAYRIESDKLYETNKMLADISAGLGVDMNRLILAYGQVRSATYLRGTELRQFTEAGIPLLEELAKQFEKVEGRAVSVGEVFGRISKRMVTFEDVEQVFERMTSDGGVFYRMQEIQSETLKGQLSNLKDSIDVMLNDIGKSTEHTLKNSIKVVKSIVDNWEMLIPIIKGLIASFAIYKINALLASQSTIKWANSMGVWVAQGKMQLTISQLLNATVQQLGKSLKNMGKSMKNLVKANPWAIVITAAISGIIKLIGTIREHNRAIEDINKEYGELRSSIESTSIDFTLASDLDEKKEKLSNLVDIANKEYNLEIKIKLKEMPEDEVNDTFNNLRDRLITLNASVNNFMEDAEKSTHFTIQDDMFKDMEDMQKSTTKLNNYLVTNAKIVSYHLQKAKDDGEELTAQQEKALGILTTPMGDRSSQQYFEDIKQAYDILTQGYREAQKTLSSIENINSIEYNRAWNELQKQSYILKSFGFSFKEYTIYANKFTKDIDEAAKEYNDFLSTIDEAFYMSLSKEDRNIYLKTAIDKLASKKEWDDFVRHYMYKWTNESKFKTYIEIVPKKPEDVNELDRWQKEYNQFVTTLSESAQGYIRPISPADYDKTREDVAKVVKETMDANDAIVERAAAGSKSYTKEEVEAAKHLAEEARKAYEWILGKEKDKGKGKDEVLERLKQRISLIKEMNKEYEKSNELFDSVDSKERVKKAFGDTAKSLGMDISKMDFSDEGTIASLESLLGDPKYAGTKYAIELKKALDNFRMEIGVERKKESDKKLLDDIQELFDQYDLSLELKKLNIPPDLAKNLFGVEFLDLKGLRDAVEGQREAFIGKGMLDEYDKLISKITEMENSATKERMKTYLEYTKSTIGERAKIKLEELKKLKEIEETFRIQEGDSKETKEYKRTQGEKASEKARQDSFEALREYEWEEFQKSDMFVSIFDDLDSASDTLINHMLEKLNLFKQEWKDMPLEDMKQIVDKINELQLALVDNNPWEAYRKSKKTVREKMGTTTFKSEEATKTMGRGANQNNFMQALQIENVYQEQKKIEAQEELGYLETALRLKQGHATEEERILQQQGVYNDYLSRSEEYLEDQAAKQKKIIKNSDNILTNNHEILSENKKQEKALKKQAENLGNAQKMANDLYDACKGLAEALGGDSDSPAAIFADMGMNMLNAVLNTIQLQIQLQAATVAANGLGVAMNTAMGIVGWIVMAIQLIAQVITAVVSAADKKRQAEIDRQLAKVEEAEKAYSRLKDTIDEAWSTEKLKRYQSELVTTYNHAMVALNAAIAAAETSKDVRNALSGNEKAKNSEEYKEYLEMLEQREELMKEHADTMKDIYSALTDGIFDSTTSAARDFTDAWYEAFAETGNGLKGLEEDFEDMFLNLAKQQASLQITGAYVEMWQKALKKYINNETGDNELTPEEAAAWANEVRATFPELSAALEAFLGTIHEGLGTGEAQGLSALQKGIQGVTEETAQVIEALLNSIRFFSADSNNELKSQTRYMRDIYNLLNGMTASHPTLGGRGIKVVM